MRQRAPSEMGNGRSLGEASDIRERIGLLPAEERRLLELRFEQGRSYRQLAMLERDTLGAMHRRVSTLMKRLCDPAIIELTRHPEAFPRRHWELALRALLAGQSIRRICQEMNVDRRVATAAVAAAKAWCAARRSEAPACPGPRSLSASPKQVQIAGQEVAS